MARKSVVDKDMILSMLREGATTQRIAEKFNVSRQAIDLHRRDFIVKGLLSNQRAARIRKIPGKNADQKQDTALPGEISPSRGVVSLDEQIDLIINAFNALKRLPQLEKEVETYKQEYENAIKEVERLKENEKKRLDQERRWFITQHNKDDNPD